MKKKAKIPGSDILCKTLESLGVETVFGLPGTQNTHLYRSLHHSSIRNITPTNELAASFMANGYYRSSGKLAAVTTIPGPGFTYALSGIAEAFLDSVPLIFLVGSPEVVKGKTFQHQTIDQKAIVRPIVKEIFEIKDVTQIQDIINKAYLTSLKGEPGPVYVEIDSSVYSETAVFDQSLIEKYSSDISDTFKKQSKKAIAEILKSQRVLFYLGQGANYASAVIREVVELFNAPVLTTSSGRVDGFLRAPLGCGLDIAETIRSLTMKSPTSSIPASPWDGGGVTPGAWPRPTAAPPPMCSPTSTNGSSTNSRRPCTSTAASTTSARSSTRPSPRSPSPNTRPTSAASSNRSKRRPAPKRG